ncbi:KTR4 [[Candida] subhashii]|uniref:KTR4 n=1 Tax=[Candida] subhashii TaxID=561895 RepID=A0A8J5UEM4_9ASCO|nr:KTR4 [[Candida] subhashii]KAG7661293.1 KTR4 [[Candida] subhashii]
MMIRRTRTIYILAIVIATVIILHLLNPADSVQYHSQIIRSFKQQISSINPFSSHELSESGGYIIKPNNVQFKFTNPKQRSTEPKHIILENAKRYKELLSQPINEPKDATLMRPPSNFATYKRANATLLALVKNQEAAAIGASLRQIHNRFNSKFKYPITLLNDKPFTDNFIRKMSRYIPEEIEVEYVTIPKQLWDKPDNIDLKRETHEMDLMEKHDIAYAKKQSYHNMCRFYSGNIYNVPELQKYKYYWRIEPGINYFTDINYDVFRYLEDTGKIYGFTISLYDIEESIKTLWPETLNYLNKDNNYKYIDTNGSFQWLVEDLQNPQKNKVAGGYSTCHFWSNFEIADMDFFRGDAYNNWFKYLDSTGKFYYERWGDAPVHSIGVSLFADKKKIHWFRDIGYFHDPYFNCPNTPTSQNCEIGKFSLWEHLNKENCLMNWVDYEMTPNVY